MKKSTRTRSILIPLLIVIVLPLLILTIVRQGKNVYKPLPFIGLPDSIGANGDTFPHTVLGFTGIDQFGKVYNSDSLKGKIYVAQFFFTSCGSICVPMTKNLKKDIYDIFKGRDEFRIVSFTMNPERDTAEKMMKFAQKYEIDGKKWHFVNMPKDKVLELMGTDGYYQVTPSDIEGTDQINHSPIVNLIDKEGHIRGTYDATKDDEVERLRDEIKLLMIHYEHNK